jgi:hypothetical protein
VSAEAEGDVAPLGAERGTMNVDILARRNRQKVDRLASALRARRSFGSAESTTRQHEPSRS